jgi:hypothetical protein
MTAATATTLRAAVLLRRMSLSRSRVFPEPILLGWWVYVLEKENKRINYAGSESNSPH